MNCIGLVWSEGGSISLYDYPADCWNFGLATVSSMSLSHVGKDWNNVARRSEAAAKLA